MCFLLPSLAHIALQRQSAQHVKDSAEKLWICNVYIIRFCTTITVLRFFCSGVHFARGLLRLDGIDSSSADLTTCSSIQSGNGAETASLSCPLAISDKTQTEDVVLISYRTPTVKTVPQKSPQVHLYVSMTIFGHLWSSIYHHDPDAIWFVHLIHPPSTGWWCGICFICPSIGNSHPNWRTPSFFRGVGQPPTR
jgi:hypothetical protein